MNNSTIILSRSITKYLLFIIVFFAVTPIQAQEQPLINYDKNVKVGLGTRGNINLNFEHAINSFSSVQVNYRLHAYDEAANQSKFSFPILPFFILDLFGVKKTVALENKVVGHSLSLEYRFYVSRRELGKKLKGIYFAPQASLGRYSQTYQGRYEPYFNLEPLFSSPSKDVFTGNTKQTTWGLGMKVGYQKRWNKFTFDCGVDIRKNSVIGNASNFEASNGETIPFAKGIDGVTTSAYFSVGMSF
ncbi:MAG: hypothetical protein AB8G15_11720 [Saprospiraceae bacterium]